MSIQHFWFNSVDVVGVPGSAHTKFYIFMAIFLCCCGLQIFFLHLSISNVIVWSLSKYVCVSHMLLLPIKSEQTRRVEKNVCFFQFQKYFEINEKKQPTNEWKKWSIDFSHEKPPSSFHRFFFFLHFSHGLKF